VAHFEARFTCPLLASWTCFSMCRCINSHCPFQCVPEGMTCQWICGCVHPQVYLKIMFGVTIECIHVDWHPASVFCLWNLCNKNQLDALFILSLFHQSTSTCVRHICSPSSGGILIYIYIHTHTHTHNWYVLWFLVGCLLAWKAQNVQIAVCVCVYIYIYIHTHTVYLLMMGYKYARNM
jgi:hypothetical protein